MMDKKKDKTTKFLIYSFIGILLFSVILFSFLGVYMNSRSKKTVYDVAEVYMSGLNDQMANHFESVINLRFDQAEGIVSAVEYNETDTDAVYEELVYRAQIRNFDYLALCSENGEFTTLYGDPIRPQNPEPFVEGLINGEKRVAVGLDSRDNEIVLFGVQANYLLDSGERCTGLVAAVPLEYVTDFLSLDNEDQMMFYYILRPDGSFVIEGKRKDYADYFRKMKKHIDDNESFELPDEGSLRFAQLIKDSEEGAAEVIIDGEGIQLYGTPLPCSEWYLVAVMPYGVLDYSISRMGSQFTVIMIVSCVVVIVLFSFIFVRYFSITHYQIDELEKARQEANKSSRAKSEFLANMSHDIRTPMNAIVGMTAIAAAHIDDKEQVRGCLKKITTSSKHLLGLINDVLDMSKIESGKLTLTPEQISLREVTEGIVSIMQPNVKARGQNFDVHVDNFFAENVWCDGVRLNQVMLNLLSNATKYTPEGGTIRLSLSEEVSEKGDNYVRVCISVKDNGIGMTKDFMEKIFESYSRADNARVHQAEGAGLGMAITKYIVDAMQGTIDVKSEVGKGTEFTVTIDVEKADMPDVDMVLPAWNMLVVDDDETLCRTSIKDLKSIGINAEWTLSGEKALDMVKHRHSIGDDYQIILLDWKLPGMNGIQTASEIRKSLGNEVPILLISAYDWSDFEAEAREAGVNGFISKPLFKSTLFHALNQYMTGSGHEEAAKTETAENLSGMKILIAEDNELNWEIANELLCDIGAEPEWAKDGKIAVDMFNSSQEGYYKVILMDLRMPHMTGYEATRAIRSSERGDALTVPIIAMSADAFSDDIKRCLDCEMNAHIAKPIDISELVRTIKKFCI